ncbi:MAG: hypothetical protein ACTS22_01045 [Phycisphaerales bacterium]
MSAEPVMNTGVVVRVFAGVSALACFVVVVLSGLRAQNSASHVLLQAILAMPVAYVFGTLLGMLSEHVVREHIDRYRAERPVEPEVPSAEVSGEASAS